MNVQGAAKYQKAEYEGLLQKDLASAVKDSSNCKRDVFNDLKDKVTSSPKTGAVLN
jgi:hypothetical protein